VGGSRHRLAWRTSINSPKSSASDVCMSLFEILPLVVTSGLLFPFKAFFSFEFFFACLFFLGLGFSIGAASDLSTGSLKQSRKVS
jgi:hypothetical protein